MGYEKRHLQVKM